MGMDVKGVSSGSGSEEKDLQPIVKRPTKKPVSATAARAVQEVASGLFERGLWRGFIRGALGWRSGCESRIRE